MFEELRDCSIKVNHKRKSSLIYIPNIISIEPLNNLYEATEWLVKEAIVDRSKVYKLIEKRRKVGGYAKENIEDIDALGIRIGSRTQGYVNQLCLMEDLLVFEYDRMGKFLKEASVGDISFIRKRDYTDLLKRMEPVRTFRNKVVAHTAYTTPKFDKKTGLSVDNPETVVRSALNLFPGRGNTMLGNRFFNGFSNWRSELPVISIYSWEEHAKLILADWKELFLGKMIEVHDKCPVQNKNYSIEVAYRRKVSDLQKFRKS
jgi:hypothetical protein